MFIFDFRSKPEVHSKVKVDFKPNQIDKCQPALSRRVTRSQTKSAQSKEPSQTSKLVTTRTRGRANKLKTTSQTMASVSSLGKEFLNIFFHYFSSFCTILSKKLVTCFFARSFCNITEY